MAKLSGVAGKMWEVDPNHSVWTLMTKAWSIIRDQIGKPNAPLDQFLKIACPFLNLPSPEIYLELQGWSVTLSNEGELQLHRDSLAESSSFSARCPDMAYSVEDIIKHCQLFGFALDFIHDKNATSPTFLAYSNQQAARKQSKVQQAVHVADNAHEIRVLAKKQRRAKRQNLRNTGRASVLQKQIVNMHVSDDDKVPIENYPEPADPQFFDHIANILTNNMGNNMTGNMINYSAVVNNMASNTPNHYAAVNNMTGHMINNYVAVPIVPARNSSQPMGDETEVEDQDAEAEHDQEQIEFDNEQMDSNDDVDSEGEETNFNKAARDMTNFNAFRNGADKNATLPPFGKNTL